MRKALLYSLVAAVLILRPQPLHAQTAAVSELTSPIDLSNPGNATARVTRLAGETGKEAIDKYLQGAVRIVPGQAGAGPKVSIEWFGLSSDATGGDTISLAPSMATTHAPQASTLPGGMELPVAGDVNALVRAARTIAENAKGTEGEGEEEDEGEKVASNTADGAVANAGSGSPIENEEAQLPTIQGVTATETVETVVNSDAYGETTEGCTPEISDDETYVIILKAPTKNGIVDGDCEQSIDRPIIQTTYIGCGYDTTTDPLKAIAKRRRYYVFGGTSTDIDTECVNDTETTFTIIETPDGCQVVPDLEKQTAKQHTARIFIGRENERVQVDSCAARDGQEFPITFELCAYRDDFPNDRTFETHIAKYSGPDGLARNIGNCTDTGKFYTHVKDTSVCPQLADFAANKLFEQYRVRIDLPTGADFRTPACKPFASALTDLQETQAGCESFHRDYAGFSLGGKRIIRLDNQQQIRECREADLRYEHIYEAQGWVNDDANLQAKPMEATYIELPQPAGRTLIAAAAVRAGVAPQAYVFERTYSEDGNVEYIPDSCDRYVKQKKMEEYRRPDGTIYKRQNGFNTSIGPSHDCTTSVSPTWTSTNYNIYTRVGQGACGCGGSLCLQLQGKYQGTRTTTRGDGVVISTENGVGQMANSCGHMCANVNANTGSLAGSDICPSTMTDQGQISTWKGALGW